MKRPTRKTKAADAMPGPTERQVRFVVPPGIWADLVEYCARNGYDYPSTAAREILRETLAKGRQAPAV